MIELVKLRCMWSKDLVKHGAYKVCSAHGEVIFNVLKPAICYQPSVSNRYFKYLGARVYRYVSKFRLVKTTLNNNTYLRNLPMEFPLSDNYKEGLEFPFLDFPSIFI